MREPQARSIEELCAELEEARIARSWSENMALRRDAAAALRAIGTISSEEMEVHVRLAFIDFMAAVTGFKPPINKEAVPPELAEHFEKFVQAILKAIGGVKPNGHVEKE